MDPNELPFHAELRRISGLSDEVDRAEAYEELLADAQTMARMGQPERSVSLALFEALADLDPDEPLLEQVRLVASEQLMEAGLLEAPSVRAVLADLDRRLQHLPEQQRLLAIARSLWRQFSLSGFEEDHGEAPGPLRQAARREALAVALHHLERAAALQPLPRKDEALRTQLRRA